MGKDAAVPASATAPASPVPSWLRRAIETPQTLEDTALASGAAIGVLDAGGAPAGAMGWRLAPPAGVTIRK